MVDVSINVSGAVNTLDRALAAIVEANDLAIHDAAEVVLNPLRVNLSHTGGKAPIGELGTRTGQLVSQTVAKYFHRRNGLLGVALKVMGDRRFIAHMNEYGTKSHGRVPGFKTIKGNGIFHKGKRVSRESRRMSALRHGNSALPGHFPFAYTWRAVEAAAIAAYEESFSRNFESRVRG